MDSSLARWSSAAPAGTARAALYYPLVYNERDAPVALTTAPRHVSAPRAPVAASLLLGLLLASGAGAQPRGPAPAKGSPGPPEPAPLRIATALVAGRVVERSIDTTGRLGAWEEAVVRAQASGTVVRLYADLGDPVREGQPLADLDRREADLAVDQLTADLNGARERLARARAAADASRANLERVRDGRRALVTDLERARTDAEAKRRELERAQELRAKDLIATRDVDQARARSEAADALVQSAETALDQHGEQLRAADAELQAELTAVTASAALVREREAAVLLGRARLTATVVASPLTGVVAKRHVSPGELVPDNAPLFTVVAADPLKYTGTVPERAAAEIRSGQAVRLTVEGYGTRVFPGEVTRVAPVVDTATRTLPLEARLLNGEGLLRPGLPAQGTVLIRRDPEVPFVPAEALVHAAGASKVFIVVEGRVEERLVKAGPRAAGWVEIEDGVRPGETVATSGLAQLHDGAPVTPMAPAPAATP
jgi:membrane fusion protein, multidrug efflux system